MTQEMLPQSFKKLETMESVKREFEAFQKKQKQAELMKDQEILGLRKKLEQKEECNVGLATLKRKLEDKEEELDSLKAKTKKQDQFVNCLKEGVECPVCLDIPRSGPVPVCPNGHLVCKKCKRDACPTCRAVMGTGRSLLAVTIIEKVDHKCKFLNCDQHLPLGDLLENHEAECLQRFVICPKPLCGVKVPLSELMNHLLNSAGCCRENDCPLEALLDKWNVQNFEINIEVGKVGTWGTHIYNFDGKVFAIFPLQSGRIYYFILVMFASVAECSKYKMQMMVHEHNTEAESSVNATKFLGNPLSIDTTENYWKLYSINGQLMRKIMEKSASKRFFSLSFKITKSD